MRGSSGARSGGPALGLDPEPAARGFPPSAGREAVRVDEARNGADAAAVELVVLEQERAAEVAEDEDPVGRRNRLPLEQPERRAQSIGSRASSGPGAAGAKEALLARRRGMEHEHERRRLRPRPQGRTRSSTHGREGRRSRPRGARVRATTSRAGSVSVCGSRLRARTRRTTTPGLPRFADGAVRGASTVTSCPRAARPRRRPQRGGPSPACRSGNHWSMAQRIRTVAASLSADEVEGRSVRTSQVFDLGQLAAPRHRVGRLVRKRSLDRCDESSGSLREGHLGLHPAELGNSARDDRLASGEVLEDLERRAVARVVVRAVGDQADAEAGHVGWQLTVGAEAESMDIRDPRQPFELPPRFPATGPTRTTLQPGRRQAIASTARSRPSPR